MSDELDQAIERALDGERVPFRIGDGLVVYIVPKEDAELLEYIEDRIDIERARKAIEEDPVGKPYQEFWKELGLD